MSERQGSYVMRRQMETWTGLGLSEAGAWMGHGLGESDALGLG